MNKAISLRFQRRVERGCYSKKMLFHELLQLKKNFCSFLNMLREKNMFATSFIIFIKIPVAKVS